MQKTNIKVINRLGLHARPASKLVKLASTGRSKVTLIKDGKRVNGCSILGVMLLEAEQGSEVTVEVEGEDEEEIILQIIKLFEDKFDEE